MENQPYGIAQVLINEMLYPEGHPYHWPVIGYMEDLTAASYDDVVAFFKKFYAPSNASLVVAGDIDTAAARRLVEKWFSDVKAGPPPEPMAIPAAALTGRKTRTVGDQVQLPRLYLAWLTPRHLAPGDATLDVVADMLAGGKNSRLYKRLVYDMQIAQDVSAFQASAALSSSFMIIATARPGHTAEELQKVIDEEIEKLQREPPTAHELERSLNQIEASFYNRHRTRRRLQRHRPISSTRTTPKPAIRIGSTKTWRDIARCRRRTSAPPPPSSCRSTNASS